jgi:DNA-binding transcriptional ArsR family regulator
MHFHAMDQREARSRNLLACLGDASRFRLVLSLLERELCVTELAAEVGLSQSCTTRHLQYLEREGLVRGIRQGKRVVFRLRSDGTRVRELLAWVTAASKDSGHERVSGAEIHVEHPPPARRPRAPRRETEPETGPVQAPPASDRPWVGDGPDGSVSDPAWRSDGEMGAAGSGSVVDRQPDSGPSGAAGEMEDWLL